MIFIDGGKKDEESQLYQKTRAWLDAANRARESRDQVDAARANQAVQDLLSTVQYVKSGHIRIREEDKPFVLAMDILFAQSPMAAMAFRVCKPVAKRLVVLARDLEDDIRVMLAGLSKSEVPARSTSMDADEDKMLGGS